MTRARKGSRLQSGERKEQQAVWRWPEPLDHLVHAQDIGMLCVCVCTFTHKHQGGVPKQPSAPKFLLYDSIKRDLI